MIYLNQPGPFSLHVRDEYHHIEDERYGRQPMYECASTYKTSTLSEDGEYEPIDFVIEPVGVIAGIVLDAQGEPVNDVTVLPHQGEIPSFHSQTEEDGLFWLYTLPKGEVYDLHVKLPGQTEPVLVLEQIEAPNKDVLIQLPELEE